MVKILIIDDDDLHKGLVFIPKSCFPDWFYTRTRTHIHTYIYIKYKNTYKWIYGIPNSTRFRVLMNIDFITINSKVIHQSFLGAFWGNKVINVLNILKASEYSKPNHTCISLLFYQVHQAHVFLHFRFQFNLFKTKKAYIYFI